MTTSVTLLGATGSIGRSTVEVLKSQGTAFRVEAVAGGRDVAALAATAIGVGARFAALADPDGLAALRDALANDPAIASLAVPSDPDYAATRAFQRLFPEGQVVLLLPLGMWVGCELWLRSLCGYEQVRAQPSRGAA